MVACIVPEAQTQSYLACGPESSELEVVNSRGHIHAGRCRLPSSALTPFQTLIHGCKWQPFQSRPFLAHSMDSATQTGLQSLHKFITKG